MMQPKLSDRFILPKIRPKQQEILDRIQEGINAGYKIFMVEAPTGIGKSAIAVTLARALGSSFIVTATKDLQEQYNQDWHFIQKMMGRGNFQCQEVLDKKLHDPSKPETKTCDFAPCQAFNDYQCQYMPDFRKYRVTGENTDSERIDYVSRYGKFGEKMPEPCTYYDHKFRGMLASHSILNYKMFIGLGLLGGQLEPRELMVFDECHRLEEELTEVQGFTITERRLKRFFTDSLTRLPQDFEYDLNRWIEYCHAVRNSLNIFLSTGKQFRHYIKRRREAEQQLQQTGDTDFITNRDFELMPQEERERYAKDDVFTDAEDFRNKVTEFISSVSSGEDWIVAEYKRDEKTNRIIGVSIKPLSVKPIVEKVFQMAEYKLLMSATILGKDAYCSILGVNPNEVLYISVGSDFPIANRRVYPLDIAAASVKNEAEYIPKFAKVIDRIMDKYPDQKGIIHTTSYRQSQEIKKHLSLKNVRRLLETGGILSREEIVREHRKADKPTVLFSPSMRTGLDLKDDLSRFQVIVKVPYPYLGDRVVDAKKTKNVKWYVWSTVLELVQSYGRSVRSSEDHADTFILDSNFTSLLSRQAKDMLPAWFREAIVTDKQDPLLRELTQESDITDPPG